MAKRELLVHRKAYSRVGTRIPATTYKVEDRGLPGRGIKVLPATPEERKGALIDLGYNIGKPTAQRRVVLIKAISKYGSRSVWGMLHKQYILRKNDKNMSAANIFRADRNWISVTYSLTR